ncbi:MAG: GumC family protein [Chitinispirillaceae bacterium]
MEKIDFWSTICRRKLIIVVSLLLVISIAGAYLLLTAPIYESYCHLLLIDDGKLADSESFSQKDFMIQTLGKSDPVLTQIQMLKTRPVIEEVIRRCDIRDDLGEFATRKMVLEKFRFEHVKSTNLIRISCRDKNREKAALYVNTLAEVFLEQNQFINRQNVRNVKSFLENQLIVQKRKVEEAERMVIDFKRSSKTVSLGEETSVRVTALAELEAERIKLESELKGLEAQSAEIEKRLNLAGSRAAPNYSSLAASREQIAISMTNINARLRSVRIQISLQNQNMKDVPPLEIQLAKLEREERIMNEIYSNLLTKYEEYKIREAANVGSIKIVEPAAPPRKPVFPQKKKGMALAGMAGIFFGLGAAFLFEYIKDRPHDINEVKNILNTSVLGAVPYLHKESQFFMKDDPRSAAAEAVRLIHTNLKFKNVLGRDHVALMVTSAQPGEGKSLVTVNLASAFACLGRKTALVSLDLRRPAFDRVFKRKFGKGLTDYLIGEANMGQISWSADFIPNLTVVPSGRIPPNPTELTISPRMESFIELMKSSFDIVLFDTAPITMVAETLELARKEIDGIVLVADISGTSRKGLVMMNEMLQGKKLPVLGVVANKIGKELRGRYGMYGYVYRDYLSTVKSEKKGEKA